MSKDNQRIANWRLWIERLDLGQDFTRVVDACAEVVVSGERIPDAVITYTSRAIARARGQHEVGQKAAPDADPVAVEALQWMFPEIRRAARSVARRWPQVVTEEDLTQAIFLHFLERKGSTLKLADMVPGERAGGLVRVGHQIASQEREKYDHFSGQFSYSVDEVRTALEDGALTASEDSIRIVALDAQRALEHLEQKTPGYATALTLRYIDGELPTARSSGAKLLERSVDALTSRMNRNRSNERAEYANGGGRGSVNHDHFGEDTP